MATNKTDKYELDTTNENEAFIIDGDIEDDTKTTNIPQNTTDTQSVSVNPNDLPMSVRWLFDFLFNWL